MGIFVHWSMYDMRHFWQWLCGYVCVLLRGRQINRFLNLCSKNGIRLWKISSNIEHTVHVYIGLKDIYYLKPYLRKTKTRFKIVSKKGFPFWCHRHPRLKWMGVSLLILLCIFLYSLNFVWQIEIQGNDKISSYELIQFLEEHNITTGIKKDTIDCSSLESQLRQNFNEIGWISVSIYKTKLCIQMKESLYEHYESNQTDAGLRYDLVADRDGRIDSIVTRQGIPLVKKGSFVKKGQCLVMGQCEILDDAGATKEIISLCADALIYADVKRIFRIPLSEIEFLSFKIAENDSDEMLFFYANQKMNQIIKKLEENGVIILDKNVMIDKEEKNIVFIGEVITREQFGINILVEEQIDYEFE